MLSDVVPSRAVSSSGKVRLPTAGHCFLWPARERERSPRLTHPPPPLQPPHLCRPQESVKAGDEDGDEDEIPEESDEELVTDEAGVRVLLC